MNRSTRTALAVATACGGVAQAQWSLYWADEFDGTSLDTSVWEYQIGTGTAYNLPAGWGNNELQYYTNFASNASVSGGTLKITARRENFGGQQYTSARLRTRGNMDFKWGRVEARMKIPGTSGVWPAFWMLPTGSPYGGWASSGEIDIMESVNQGTRVHGTIHHGSNWPNNASIGGSIADGNNFVGQFNDYAIEWEPDQIRWYLNGEQYYSVNSSQWFSTSAPSNARAPFDHQFHLLLNVAVGGNWPGSPNSSAQYPQTLEVDYVRVYRREVRPYQGSPGIIPGQIQAENYNEGYPGEAYFDIDYGNNGNQYRQDDVDIQVCNEGGFNVGWISTGEWIDYTVDVQTAGLYELEARVSTPNPGNTFRLEVGGEDLTGPVSVPVTGGWQNWQTTTGQLELAAGLQTIRFRATNSPAGFNLNWFRFNSVGPQACSAADIAEPLGTVNVFDLFGFLDLYSAQDESADLAAPFGTFNLFDVLAYLSVYNAGCP